MKTFNRTFLTDTINYNGETYHNNPFISAAMELNNTKLKDIATELKKQGRKAILINCLSKNLKGKKDLYGQPYKPTRHIYTTK